MKNKIKTEHGRTGYGTFYRYDKFRHVMPIKRWVALKALFTGKVTLTWLVAVNKKDKSIRIEPNDPPIKDTKDVV